MGTTATAYLDFPQLGTFSAHFHADFVLLVLSGLFLLWSSILPGSETFRRYPLCSVRRVLILLVSSGISSIVERSLLASTQQRQGPNHQSGFGALVFVLDGIKLFSKVLIPNSGFISVLTTVILLYVVPLILDLALGKSLLAYAVQFQILAWFILGLLESLSFCNFLSVTNSYVTLAICRYFEIFVCLELVLSLIQLVGFAVHGVVKSSSLITPSLLLLFSIILVFVVLDLEKAPFDVVEAESELIDGWTTEFAGYAFSLVYAAEVASGFVSLKFGTTGVGFFLLTLSFLMVCVFWGRILSARITIPDVLLFVFSVGLAVSLLLLTIPVSTVKSTYETFRSF